MSFRTAATRVSAVCLLLLVLVATVAGCSNTTGNTSTSGSDTSVTSGPTTADSASTTTGEPGMMTDIQRELAKTSSTQHEFATYLTDKGSAESDPQRGIFLGLRARTNALSCRDALAKGELEIADYAMREVYQAMNQGQAVATGDVLQTLTAAREIIATLGAPSDSPEEADALLEQFITALGPLLDEATGILSTTTTLESTTST